MASTFLSLHYHIVFSTKDRTASIHPEWRARLHQYLGGQIKGLGGVAQSVGGVADHTHLLVGLKATHCLSDIVRELKKRSSVWIRDSIGLGPFLWQEGYAAFTVSVNARDAVSRYIADQESHHRETSSRDELLKLIELAKIEYNPAYFE